MARVRDDAPEPEITPAEPEDVMGIEEAPDDDTVEQDDREADKPPFLSEGVRQDLLTFGRAVDPASGGEFTRDDDSGEVTFTPKARHGETAEPQSLGKFE